MYRSIIIIFFNVEQGQWDQECWGEFNVKQGVQGGPQRDGDFEQKLECSEAVAHSG